MESVIILRSRLTIIITLIFFNFLVSSMQSSSSSLLYTKKALLFDIDGTISDSFRLGFDATQKVLLNNGYYEITEDQYHLGTKFTTPRRLAWHAMGDTEHIVGVQLGREFDDLYVDLVSINSAPLYPGIMSMFRKLLMKNNKTKFGALSNACGAYVRAVLSANSCDEIFEVSLGADEVSKAKPHPEGLLQLCEMLGVSPVDCIYVGDSPTDGQAAQAAGMQSIGVTWGSHPVDSVSAAFTEYVHTVEDLEEKLYRLL